MFDVGFSEMLVIAVVALIVIGPERLPKVARTLGHLFGRMQRYVNDVKADISREIELDELRKFKTEFQDAAQSVENSIKDGVQKAQTDFEQTESEVRKAVLLQEEADAEAKIALESMPASSGSGAMESPPVLEPQPPEVPPAAASAHVESAKPPREHIATGHGIPARPPGTA